jgi:hypothetical protein
MNGFFICKEERMSENRVTLLIQALPGLRIIDEGKTEEGSILALRHDGDECLYTPTTGDTKGMEWIPVGQFSVHPDAVTPVELLEREEGEEEMVEGDEEGGEPAEKSSRSGPFGHNLRRRPELGG